tara:strand:+ start:3500 stop:4558 length:1059 start_codon:yes stop_codon:yes gene_type:complete
MIDITAPVNNLGYGIASFNIIKALNNMGVPVKYHPIGQPEDLPESEFLQDLIEQRSSIKSLASVKIWHQNDIHHHVGKKLHVGFPIFELDRFNEQEQYSINQNDRIFVCSQWAKQIVLNNSNISDSNIFVVPLGVDTDLFQPFISGRPQTVFFNCGKWEIRKGHDVLIECFNEAFNHDDPVELWMMCENPFYSPEMQQQWTALCKNSKLGNKIRLIPRQMTHAGVYNLMKQVTCGVFPSRAEGWNLELLEVMACGKPVIATNYSAHTEFCNESNCRLIEIEQNEIANDGFWFNGQGSWAHIGDSQKQQLIDHMKIIHTQKQSGVLSQNMDGIETAKKFSWKNSAKKFLEGLE